MAEYIDRDIAIAKMIDLFVEFPDEIGHYLQGRCIGVLLFEPAADVVEVKHGKWDERRYSFCSVCSECGAIVERGTIKWQSGELNYCPNCGAKMDGEDNA